MTEISNLINIAENIGMNQAANALKAIQERGKQSEAPIYLPFVGEFSSGKTSLINALTDSKKLETKTKPTTATIFEIHFGQPKCDAEVFDIQGQATHFEDISEIKNDNIADAPFVLVNDTSTKISKTTVIIDTPGLSSPDPRHKETLVKFLPKADGIILVVDVNQSITKSLTDFIDSIKISQRPIYLVITKCDTKSPSQVESQKKYIAEQCKISLNHTACVSSSKNELDEIYELFKQIAISKAKILEEVNRQRVRIIADEITKRVDELLKVSNSDEELEQSIVNQKNDLRRFNNKIDKLLRDSEEEIEEKARLATRKFEDLMSSRFESLAKSNSNNYDSDAISAIRTNSLLVINEFKQDISQILRNKANSKKDTDDSLNLLSLQSIDMSGIQLGGLSYGLNLNSLGHEYDGMIKTGLGIAAVAAVTIATAGTGTVAAGAAATAEGAAVAAEGAAVATEAIGLMDVAQVATDIYLYNKLSENDEPKSNQSNQPKEKGMLDQLIGKITDSTMGKPQRAKAIRVYLNDTLIPEFKNEMYRIKTQIMQLISAALQNEATATINEKTQALQALKEKSRNQLQEFRERKEELKEFRKVLANQ